MIQVVGLLHSCFVGFFRRLIPVSWFLLVLTFARGASAQEAAEAGESGLKPPPPLDASITAEEAARLAGQVLCPTPCHVRHENQIPKGFKKKEPPPSSSQSWSTGAKQPSTAKQPGGTSSGGNGSAAKPSAGSTSPAGSGNGSSTSAGGARPATSPAPAAKPPGPPSATAPVIRNAHLAGKKHPVTGVPFDKDGYPDFRAAGVVKKEVKIDNMTGTPSDYATANQKAGLSKTPPDYTWHHHHQDGQTMQLVPRDLHKNSGHTGGSAIVRSRK